MAGHSVEFLQQHDDENNKEINLSDNNDNSFDFNNDASFSPVAQCVRSPRSRNQESPQYHSSKRHDSHHSSKSNEYHYLNVNCDSHQPSKDQGISRRYLSDYADENQAPKRTNDLSVISEESRANYSNTFASYPQTPLAARPNVTSKMAQHPIVQTASKEKNARNATGLTSLIGTENQFLHQDQSFRSQISLQQGNDTSLSTSRLAALDAKYAHLNEPIEKMDLNTILASLKIRRSRAPEQRRERTVLGSKENAIHEGQEPVTLGTRENTLQREPVVTTARSTSSLAIPNLTGQSDAMTELPPQRSSFISADKTVLAFGFISNNTTHELSVNISNNSDEPLWLQPSIMHAEQALRDPKLLGFRLKNTNSFSLDPQSSRQIDVEFEPKQAKTYNGQLRLRLMSKDEPEFVIQMFGYGARAQLDVYTRNFEKITMGADGVGICELNRTAKQIELVLVNAGKRDAFAHIKAVDVMNQPLSSDQVTIVPNRVIVRKNTKEYVKFMVTFRYGVASASMTARSNSQMSLGTAHTGCTLQNENLTRLQIIWGEERQRRRLKVFLSRSSDESAPTNVMEYITSHFENEGTFRNEKIVGQWDLSCFISSLRLLSVQFIDSHVRPQSAQGLTRPTSVTSVHSGKSHQPNQTLANTLAASTNTFQFYSGVSNATIEEDTLPLHGRPNHY